MENCFGIITWILLLLAQKFQDLGIFTIGDFNNLGLIIVQKCYMHIAYCKMTGNIFSKKMLPLLRRGFKGAANPNVT